MSRTIIKLRELCEAAKARTKAELGFECGYATPYTLGCNECIYGRQMVAIMKNNSSEESIIK